MKKFYSLFVILAAFLLYGAYQTVNIGTNPNDGTGDTLRTAFNKVNGNTTQTIADFASVNADIATINATLANTPNTAGANNGDPLIFDGAVWRASVIMGNTTPIVFVNGLYVGAYVGYLSPAGVFSGTGVTVNTTNQISSAGSAINGVLYTNSTEFGKRACGSIMLVGDENLDLAVAGTYYQVVNYDVYTTNYFGYNLTLGTITNLVAGNYMMTMTISFDGSGGANDIFEGAIFTNLVEAVPINWHRKTGSQDTGSASCTGILYLPANCRIDARIQNQAATGIITLRHFNLTATMQ